MHLITFTTESRAHFQTAMHVRPLCVEFYD